MLIYADDAWRCADVQRRPATVKRVRIQTPPPRSPPDPETPSTGEDSLIYRVSHENHPGSPPPLSPTDGFSSTFDSIHDIAGSSFGGPLNNQEAVENMKRNAGGASTPTAVGRKVFNPFQRTLASMESTTTSSEEQNITERPSDAQEAGGSRSVMDVDSFKRMLMTGDTGTNKANAEIGNTNEKNHDGGAARKAGDSDALESSFGTNPSDSSMKPSYTETASKGGKGLKDQRSAKKSPPPLPKHRHGRTFAPDKPQRTSSSISSQDVAPPLPPSVPEAPSVHPRPPIPKSRDSTSLVPEEAQQSIDGSVTQRPLSSGSTTAPSEASSEKQRTAPAVPLSRRSTQRNSSYQPQNSDVISHRDQTLSKLITIEQDNKSKQHQAPLPPPTRRSTIRAPSDQISLSEAASATSDSTSQFDEFPALETNYRRSLNAVGGRPGSSRSSSFSEKNAVPPPPPPPRRRRGSSRSSAEVPAPAVRSQADEPHLGYAQARTSVEGGRTTSTLSQVPEAEGNEGRSRDVLADLSALQREVDALRHNYRSTS